jgi:hypothetical protein
MFLPAKSKNANMTTIRGKVLTTSWHDLGALKVMSWACLRHVLGKRWSSVGHRFGHAFGCVIVVPFASCGVVSDIGLGMPSGMSWACPGATNGMSWAWFGAVLDIVLGMPPGMLEACLGAVLIQPLACHWHGLGPSWTSFWACLLACLGRGLGRVSGYVRHAFVLRWTCVGNSLGVSWASFGACLWADSGVHWDIPGGVRF